MIDFNYNLAQSYPKIKMLSPLELFSKYKIQKAI